MLYNYNIQLLHSQLYVHLDKQGLEWQLLTGIATADPLLKCHSVLALYKLHLIGCCSAACLTPVPPQTIIS